MKILSLSPLAPLILLSKSIIVCRSFQTYFASGNITNIPGYFNLHISDRITKTVLQSVLLSSDDVSCTHSICLYFFNTAVNLYALGTTMHLIGLQLTDMEVCPVVTINKQCFNKYLYVLLHILVIFVNLKYIRWINGYIYISISN